MPFLVIHIIPLADERDHEESVGCWCDPEVERLPDRTIVIHNAADLREEYERITGDALPRKPWLCIRDGIPMELDYGADDVG